MEDMEEELEQQAAWDARQVELIEAQQKAEAETVRQIVKWLRSDCLPDGLGGAGMVLATTIESGDWKRGTR